MSSHPTLSFIIACMFISLLQCFNFAMDYVYVLINSEYYNQIVLFFMGIFFQQFVFHSPHIRLLKPKVVGRCQVRKQSSHLSRHQNGALSMLGQPRREFFESKKLLLVRLICFSNSRLNIFVRDHD